MLYFSRHYITGNLHQSDIKIIMNLLNPAFCNCRPTILYNLDQNVGFFTDYAVLALKFTVFGNVLCQFSWFPNFVLYSL